MLLVQTVAKFLLKLLVVEEEVGQRTILSEEEVVAVLAQEAVVDKGLMVMVLPLRAEMVVIQRTVQCKEIR